MISTVRNAVTGRSRRSAGGVFAFALVAVSFGGPSQAAAMQAGAPGVVQGTVEIEQAPRRRSPQRYSRGRAQAPRGLQALPAVVYLRGGPTVTGAPGPAETVLQQDTAFIPGMLVVPPGATVDFTNEDPFFHNVFSYSEAKRFDLGRYPAGQSKRVTFEESGIVKVYCEVHDFMRFVVLVLDTPYHSPVSQDGSFTIRGVPPGSYELVAWHTDFDEQIVPITVTGGGTATVEVTLQ